jgi:NAD(P)H dehydrogenase (quinone)
VAADLIQQDWTGVRIVELEGPCRIAPNDLADALAGVIGKPVRAAPVPRKSWVLDGFNEGWIAFRDSGSQAIKGRTNAAAVVAALVAGTHHRT